MELKAAQPSGRANRSERAIRPRGDIGQLSRTVAADAIAALEVSDEVHFLRYQREAGGGTYAAADPGVIESTRSGGKTAVATGGKGCGDEKRRPAGINAVTAPAKKPPPF